MFTNYTFLERVQSLQLSSLELRTFAALRVFLPCKNFSKLCRLERRPGINKFKGTDFVQGTAGNMRESKFWDKSLMKFLSSAVFGGSLSTIRMPYLWETGTWKISSDCQAGSTRSCSSCTGGHLKKQSRVWDGGSSLVALRGMRGGGRG